MSDQNGTRTHEPSLREVVAELDGLKELMLAKLDATKDVMTVLDKLYKERDDARRTAVDAALAALREHTNASFGASEKAILKAEQAQTAYNVSHNDLSRKLDEQTKSMMPRTEAETRFRALDDKIISLRDAMTTITGLGQGALSVRENSRAIWAIVIAALGFLIMLGRALLGK